jgi:hypothetical protein
MIFTNTESVGEDWCGYKLIYEVDVSVQAWNQVIDQVYFQVKHQAIFPIQQKITQEINK